jgi:immune inhibitor A
LRRQVLLMLAAMAVLLSLAIAAAPALAGPAHMPPNEAAIIKALKHRGVIPHRANKVQIASILQQYLQRKLGAKPEDHANLGPDGAKLQGTTPLARMLRAAVGPTIDNTLVILVDFSTNDYADPAFPDVVFPGGPLHGHIPPPVAGDNSTFWPGPGAKGFGVSHYQNMLFGTSFKIYARNGALRGTSTDTMRNYYLQMSHGTYTVSGQIQNWVTLDKPESYYGMDAGNGTDNFTGDVWRVARDAVAKFAQQNPNFDWAKYDRENPFGIAGSDPNVPDGYIDHLILVHAGVDQSAGGGAQGNNAIWAHSWWIDSASGAGPGDAGGFQIPDTVDATHPDGIWAGPYTINPEDGGIGVFCHEFGHDLGLPDEYDTTYTGESPSGFWTLMDSGSWTGKKWGLGTRPSGMDAWDKMALGFTTFSGSNIVEPGMTKTFRLPPSTSGAANKTSFMVTLPDAQHAIELSGADDSHNPEWWSGMGDNLDNRLVTKNAISVPADTSAAVLTFDSWYEIEKGYDYGFVDVSTNGTDWTTVPGNNTVPASPGVEGLTGASGGGDPGAGDTPVWESESYDLSAYAGQNVYLRFRYKTDGGVSYRGWEVTNIQLGSFADSAADASQFDTDSWSIVNGEYTTLSTRYYIADYRARTGFDATLANVYNWKTGVGVQFFPYNTGLSLIYRDTFWSDNNVGLHPGEGGWMFLDAHPYPDPLLPWGQPWRSRIESRDAAFNTTRTATVSLAPLTDIPENANVTLPGRKGQPVFDDSMRWWYPWDPDAGTMIYPNDWPFGVRMVVRGTDKNGNLMVTVRGAAVQ